MIDTGQILLDYTPIEFNAVGIVSALDVVGGKKIDAVAEIDFGQGLNQFDLLPFVKPFSNALNFLELVLADTSILGRPAEILQYDPIGLKIGF